MWIMKERKATFYQVEKLLSIEVSLAGIFNLTVIDISTDFLPQHQVSVHLFLDLSIHVRSQG